MLLRPYEVEDLRRQVASGADLAPFQVAPVRAASLGGVVELACSWAQWSQREAPASSLVERWSLNIEALNVALERLRLGRNPPVVDFWRKRKWELHVIAEADEWLGADGTD